MKHRVFAAGTESSNDEWSDSQRRVWHHVTVVLCYSQEEDGREGEETITVRHYSADPQTAIDEVGQMTTALVAKMERVAS